MQKKDHNTPDTSDGNRRWSLWYCLVLGAGILATGILLLWIGDGFPPLAWRQFTPLLGEHALSRPQFALVLGQVVFLLAAWGLLLILTIRSMYHVWHHGVAGRTTPWPGESHLRGHTTSGAALTSHAPPLHQAHSAPASASLPQQVKSVGGQFLPHEDHDRDVSPPQQVPDVVPPSLAPPFQPALFGEPMQLAVGSCSVEGLQQDPSTTTYLLTDGGSYKNTSFSWPGGLFALVDHIPRDEPGHTRSCQAIETMRDRVRQACTSAQPLSDETLAALVAEQVQNVTRVIGQQSQDEEANPAMAAVLVVGSQLYLANLGDTRVYLCCSQDGFYQITDALGGVRLLTSHHRSTARPGSPHPRGKQKEQRRDTSGTLQDHVFALPLATGDSVLLCSDGLWSVLHATYLEHIIRSSSPDPSVICSALLRAVRNSGSTDAVRMIVVRCQEK
jgi:serine/threonine protein phosphatase PrpC